MMSVLTNYVLVASGGALGAMTRLFVGRCFSAFSTGIFPWHTFAINVTGSCLLGCFVTLLTTRNLDQGGTLNHFVAIGFLGAFTTFSTFEMETWNLLSEGNWLHAGAYVLGSVLTAFVGLGAGVWMTRQIAHFYL